MGDLIDMSISVDSPSDETLNGGSLALLLRRQYKFPFGINTVCSAIFNLFFLSFYVPAGCLFVTDYFILFVRKKIKNRKC